MERMPEQKMYYFLKNLDGQLFIPLYQREYMWKRLKINDFWEFIEKINLSNKYSTHYLHTITINKHETNNILDLISIVDGQQRTITISLCYAGICAFCKYHEISPDEFDWEELIYWAVLKNKLGEKDNQYRLTLRPNDNKTFHKIIDNLPYKISLKNESKIIAQTYNAIINNLTLENYKEIFYKLMQFNVGIDIVQEHDSAETIFKTINYGGQQLDKYDLLRTSTLLNQDLNTQTLFDSKYWDKLLLLVSDETNPKKKIAECALSYLKCIKGTLLENNIVEYVDYISNDTEKLKEFLEELTEFTSHYINVLNGKTGIEEIDDSLLLLSSFNLQNLNALLMFIYLEYLNNNISRTEFTQSVFLIESIIVRNKINDSLIGEIIRKECKDLNSFKKGVYSQLYDKLYSYYVDDETFREALVNNDVYIKNNKIGHFLVRINNSLCHPNEKIRYDMVSVEHVIPQTIKRQDLPGCWIRALGRNYKNVQKQSVHKLGNLTLVVNNASLSNRDFEDKKNMKYGYKDSRIPLSKSVIYDSYGNERSTWNQDTVLERSNYLADICVTLFSLTSFEKSGVKQSILVGGK